MIAQSHRFLLNSLLPGEQGTRVVETSSHRTACTASDQVIDIAVYSLFTWFEIPPQIPPLCDVHLRPPGLQRPHDNLAPKTRTVSRARFRPVRYAAYRVNLAELGGGESERSRSTKDSGSRRLTKFICPTSIRLRGDRHLSDFVLISPAGEALATFSAGPTSIEKLSITGSALSR